MFPISVEGTIDIPTDLADAALDRLQSAVVAKGARFVKRQPHKLLFTGRMFLGFSWNPLVVFDRCVVSVQSQRLEIQLLNKVCTFGHHSGDDVCMVRDAIVVSARDSGPILVLFPPLAWTVVFGGNYFVARNKLRRLIADTLWALSASKQ